MFYCLKDKYNVKFIINESFNIKNNIESLYLARKELKNTYICVSDSYFVENPFNQYEYDNFNAGIKVNEKLDEIYANIDSNKRINKISTQKDNGYILLGHAYWTKEFSSKFIELACKDREVGKYASKFWELLVKDNLKNLPPFYFKEYKVGNIFEFDYFEDLRKFDTKYFHFMAYTAIIAYYWFVWAMYREQCGFNTGESLNNWCLMAKKYADYLLNNK